MPTSILQLSARLSRIIDEWIPVTSVQFFFSLSLILFLSVQFDCCGAVKASDYQNNTAFLMASNYSVPESCQCPDVAASNCEVFTFMSGFPNNAWNVVCEGWGSYHILIRGAESGALPPAPSWGECGTPGAQRVGFIPHFDSGVESGALPPPPMGGMWYPRSTSSRRSLRGSM